MIFIHVISWFGIGQNIKKSLKTLNKLALTCGYGTTLLFLCDVRKRTPAGNSKAIGKTVLKTNFFKPSTRVGLY